MKKKSGDNMKTAVPVMIAAILILLIMSLVKKKISLFLNFGLRVVFGFLGVYFVNFGLGLIEVEAQVGYNPVTFLTLGTLGFSGFFLLYGIVLGKFL